MRRNATRRLSRTFVLSIPDSARGFLFRRFPSFPLGGKECLRRKALFFPERHAIRIILEVSGKRLGFSWRHDAKITAQRGQRLYGTALVREGPLQHSPYGSF